MRGSRRSLPNGALFLVAGLLLCVVTLGASASKAQAPNDAVTPLEAWNDLLGDAEIEPADLSRRAAPDWLGHADAATVPFLLPHHPWVADDPRHLLRLGENLLVLAESEAREGRPSLAPVLTGFVLQPRLPGFRGFAQSPRAVPRLAELLERADADPVRAATLPEDLHRPVAQLLHALLDATDAVESSWRHVTGVTLQRALATPDVPRLLPGASVPWPDLEDAARLGRDVERAAAALRLAAALAAALDALDLPPDADIDEPWRVETRHGPLVVAGRAADRHEDARLVLDLGGDDAYVQSAAARMPQRPAALVVDLGGNDSYQGTTASGVGGVALLADLGGDDVYGAEDGAGVHDGTQGYGLLGYGILYDLEGNDRYRAAGGAQGAAVFGGGLLLDASGDDSYEIDGEGQGFGGPGAAGALVDLAGNDVYRAEPDPAKAGGRADYHSEGRVNASNAQGAGVGRRGELTDGQVWAGGVGVLLDLGGRDLYEAGNFAQASGYAYGTGLLLDGAGDDEYRSTYFAQASASHEAFALLLDRAGDDRHHLAEGAGLGYGWDLAVGVLADESGDDRFRTRRLALGAADRSSVGVFLELGGDDRYAVSEGDEGIRLLGASGGDPRNGEPGRPPHRAVGGVPDLGLFLDLGGKDLYPPVRGCEPADGGSWRCGASGTDGRVVGYGIDREP